MSGTDPRYYSVMEGTWPAAAYHHAGPWLLRDGQGGGKRVAAATAEAPVTAGDLPAAVDGLRLLGQPPLFLVRDGQAKLDKALEDAGYDIVDPVVVFSCPVEQLTDLAIPRVTVFTIWEPLWIMREIWAQGGICPARLAVMDRAAAPKTGLFARHSDKPAGVGFVAMHDRVAMVHALEILPHQRRLGLGAWVMRAAAHWAHEQGAHELTVMCTKANAAACALYTSLGMTAVGQYHYRALKGD